MATEDNTSTDDKVVDDKVVDDKKDDDKVVDDKKVEDKVVDDKKDDDKAADKDDSKDKDDDKDKDDKDEKAGAPEKYEAFKIPDGFEMDDEILTTFTDYARESNLSQEAAQKAINLHSKVLGDFVESQQSQWDAVVAGWADEVKADKSLQDEKGSTEAAIATASLAIEALGGEALKDALELTKAGSHPAVVKAFNLIGARIAEGKLVFGNTTSTDERTAAQRLYPTMK